MMDTRTSQGNGTDTGNTSERSSRPPSAPRTAEMYTVEGSALPTSKGAAPATEGLGICEGVQAWEGDFPLPSLTESQAFSVIRAAREVIGTEDCGENTAKQYAKVAKRFLRLIGEQFEVSADTLWIEALDHYPNADSFNVYKSAVCWHLRQEIRERLQAQDRQQRDNDRGPVWLNNVGIIEQRQREYENVHAHLWAPKPKPDKEIRKLIGPPRADGRKKFVLKKLVQAFPNWMSATLLQVRHGIYLDAVRVLSMIGCRPEELAHGVKVELNPFGHMVLTVMHGAKVTKEAGQPWRRITLPGTGIPWAWRARLQGGAHFVVKIASKDGLRKKLHRISEKLFPGMLVSAYCFRHSLATRIRGTEVSTEDLAAFLGHSVAKTQAKYGHKKSGGFGLKSKRWMTVEVPRPVKPIDRSGLDAILSRAGNKKKNSPR